MRGQRRLELIDSEGGAVAGPALSILVPVLKRPHRVKPLLESISAATPEAQVLFLADPDDLPELEAIRFERRRCELAGLPLCVSVHATGGNYARKINQGVELSRAPLLFFGADDLHFHPGWLEAARSALGGLERAGIGAVGTNDLCNPKVIAGDHATHFLVARWYAELGAIDGGGPLHEGYEHEWVDNEFIETARRRGAYAHAGDAIVEHLHPMAGKAESDALYAAAPERMRSGHRIFRQRRPLWAA